MDPSMVSITQIPHILANDPSCFISDHSGTIRQTVGQLPRVVVQIPDACNEIDIIKASIVVIDQLPHFIAGASKEDVTHISLHHLEAAADALQTTVTDLTNQVSYLHNEIAAARANLCEAEEDRMKADATIAALQRQVSSLQAALAEEAHTKGGEEEADSNGDNNLSSGKSRGGGGRGRGGRGRKKVGPAGTKKKTTESSRANDDEEEEDNEEEEETVPPKDLPKPLSYVDPDAQMDEWEVVGEEGEERIVEKRKVLGVDTPIYSKNFSISASLPLGVDCRLVHKECTEDCEAETIIPNLFDVVDTLVQIYDLNQSIVEQVHEKDGKTNARIVRGGGVASMLNSVEATLESATDSSEVLEAGRRALLEAKKDFVLNYSGKSTDQALNTFLYMRQSVRNFIFFVLNLASGYLAFYLAKPEHLLPSSASGGEKKAFRDLYALVCPELIFGECTESLTFVLRLTKYLRTFKGGELTEEERTAVKLFLGAKETLIQTKKNDTSELWTSVDGYRMTEGDEDDSEDDDNDDDDTDNSKHFADGSNRQRDSVNLVVFMVCGSQIDKLLSEDERFKGAEDFSSLVLRSTVYQTKLHARALACTRAKHRLFEAGRGLSALGADKSDQLVKFFTDCGENIKEFERDMFIVFDLDEDETASSRKKELVFRRFEALTAD